MAGGRGLKKIVDFEQFEKLCTMQCTQKEIMDFFNIQSKDTINARIREHYGENECFKSVYERFKSGGKIAIRRKQFQVGMSGNTSMLIWLGKNWLDQSDKQDIVQAQEISITIDDIDSEL